jgi:hypothetical protein
VQAVDVQPCAGAARICTARPNLKGKKINVKEDELVVSAWLNVSKDLVQGANQYYEKKKTIESRVRFCIDGCIF